MKHHGSFRVLARGLGALAFAATFAPASIALAQDDTQKPSAAQPALTPPVLDTFVDAPYPAEALAAGLEGTVTLALDIDASGKVTSAVVKESAGHGFDEAAIAAALKFVFVPAKKGDAPIAARILYRYAFTLKPPPAPPAEEVAPKLGRLHGFIRAAGEAPIEGARVVIVSSAGAKLETRTTADGSWQTTEIPPGKYAIAIEAPGYDAVRADEDVRAGESTDVIYRMRLAKDGAVEVTVRGDPPPREVTRHELSRAELSRVPGTNGDALKAIQSMPGVARPPGPTGLLIVRGSAPQDTQIFVDGTPVPIIYHFAGFSSVVPTESIEKLDFYPGNFGAQYGRAIGGVVDVALRAQDDDHKFHALGQVDLIDGRVMARGPIGKDWTFFVAGRRSWIDAWLGPALDATHAVGTTSAPVYYDYQAFAETHPTTSSRFRIGYFGSDDKLQLFLKNPTDGDPGIAGDLSNHTGFGRIQALYENRFSDAFKLKSVAAWGYDTTGLTAGELKIGIDDKPLTSRTEASYKVARFLTVNVGEDFEWHHTDLDIRAPQPPRPGETSPGPIDTQRFLEQKTTRDTTRPGFYADAEIQPTESLRVVVGGRVDYTSATDTVDPSVRASFRYDIQHDYPRTTIKGGAGSYYQPPQGQETDAVFGSKGLRSNHANQYSIGVEHEFTRQIDLSLETYYKDLTSLVTRVQTQQGAQYENSGSGYVAGAEVLLRYKPTDRFFGWIAYSLSRSERRDADGQPLSLFQYDQTHILTALGSYKIGAGWEVGAQFRFVSGNLYTPCVGIGGAYDSAAGSYTCISGAPFSQRLPPFHELDVRVDKTFQFDSWKLGLYADIKNIYNYQSPDNIQYNFNNSQTTYQNGLPIIPSLGVRGEF